MSYDVYVIHLSAVDKVRIVFGNVSASEFIGILTPYVRKYVSDGQLFTIAEDPGGRCFRYVIKEGNEFISSDSGLWPLSKGKSLTEVILNKFKNNPISQGYNDVKNALTIPFGEQLDQ